jgi:hypothetical protein
MAEAENMEPALKSGEVPAKAPAGTAITLCGAGGIVQWNA